MSKERKLKMVNGENHVGDIVESEGQVVFTYDEAWIGRKDAFDISPNIKRLQKTHSGIAVKNFLENLLPEDTIRKRIAENNKTDDKDIVGLLEITGKDAAGALQIYSESEYQNIQYDHKKEYTINIADLAAGIKKQGSALNYITSVGLKPSLSGAQDKIACRYHSHENKIGFPTNGGATTYILKPNSVVKDKEHKSLEFSALNELVVMRLAKKILVQVPNTLFYESDDRDLFIIERYDRHKEVEEIKRIHQFDFCQYFGISSSEKYEVSNSGRNIGPYGIKKVFEAIKLISEEPRDIELFLDWVVFNYLIENTDSHLKNISMIATGTGFKLAPFYDMTSVGFYQYKGTFLFDNHFAFLVGGISKMNEIGDHHWTLLAKDLNVSPGLFLEKIKTISIKISKHLSDVYRELQDEKLNSKNIKGVEKLLKYIGTSVKEKSYRCLINNNHKIVPKKCSVCDKTISEKMSKQLVLGICSECLMRVKEK